MLQKNVKLATYDMMTTGHHLSKIKLLKTHVPV